MQNKRLLVIGYTWPEPATTAAGNRMLQLLQFFLDEGYQVTFSSTASASDNSVDFEMLGITSVPIVLNNSSFDKFLIELNPDIVLFDRYLTEEQFGWRVAESVPEALRILDTEDLHSLRSAREKAFKKQITFTTDYWLSQDNTKRELASIFRSDLSLIISSYEMQLLSKIVGVKESILLYLPFMVDSLSAEKIENLKPFEERKDFICVGNGKHSPNVDALVWLKKEIWPLIREQLPDVNLHVYGAYLPEHIEKFHNKEEGFLVHGWVAHVKTVMEKAKVNLAPLRFGAGLKGKILDAMIYGTPTITTAIGVEGMHDGSDLEFCGEKVETPKDFLVAALNLYTAGSTWKIKQMNGVKIIDSVFNKEVHEKALSAKVAAVQEDLEYHRNQNMIGQMLLHQTMASTKYMSKWIEEKNSK